MGSKRYATPNYLYFAFEAIKWFWIAIIFGFMLVGLCSVMGVWTEIKRRQSLHNAPETIIAVPNALDLHQPHLFAQIVAEEEINEKAVGLPFELSRVVLAGISTHASSRDATEVVRQKQRVVTETLLSAHRPVTSDVQGNLGPPGVVTDEKTADWLKDRWQSARNMMGDPIPGEHFLEVDLQRLCTVTKFLVDWELAWSNRYTIYGHTYSGGAAVKTNSIPGLTKLSVFRDARSSSMDKHVVHEMVVPHASPVSVQYRYVRLVMHGGATKWAPSVWRFQIYGWEGSGLEEAREKGKGEGAL